jgi:hypothetical protein
MIIVKNTTRDNGTEEVNGNVLYHGPVYVLKCEDKVGNEFEIETNQETYAQVTQFLDALKQV